VPVGEELAIAAQLSKNPNVEFAEPDWITKLGPCEVSTACNLPDGQFFHYKWDLHNTGHGAHAGVHRQGGRRHRLGGDVRPPGRQRFAGLGGDRHPRHRHPPTHQAVRGQDPRRPPLPERRQPVTNYTDDQGHGTHVAGIAAGRGTSAVPGVGYGKNIKLLVGKVCNSAGSCPSSATADGIVWMADNGANVINMSLGSFGGNPDGTGSAAQQAALRTR
jgi:subtilisin family serine protease